MKVSVLCADDSILPRKVALAMRTNKIFLNKDQSIERKKIMGIRNTIVHHYFDIDIEIVFDAAKLPDLKNVISQMIIDLKNNDFD